MKNPIVSALSLLLAIMPIASLLAQSPLESLTNAFALNTCVSQRLEPAERIEQRTEQLEIAESPEAFGISLVGRGWAKFELGRVESAVDDFRQALDQGSDETRPDAFLGLGYAYTEIGDFDLAIDSFNQAVSLSLFPVHAYTARGSLRASMGQYDLAIADFDRALAMAPRFVPTLVARGETHLRFGEYEAALRDLDFALELSPNEIRAVGARGELHCALGNLEQSVEDAFQMYALSSHEVRTHLQSMLADNGYYDGPLDGGSEEDVLRELRFGAEDLCAI